MNTFGILLAVSLFGILLHSAYIHLVRPVFFFAIRRRLIALRDDLKVSALTGKIPKEDEGFRILDQRLKQFCEGEFLLSLTMLMFYKQDAAEELQGKRDNEILAGSDPLIREINNEARLLLTASVIVNSPMWWLVLPILFVAVPFSGKAKRISNRIMWNGPDGFGNSGMCPA